MENRQPTGGATALERKLRSTAHHTRSLLMTWHPPNLSKFCTSHNLIIPEGLLSPSHQPSPVQGGSPLLSPKRGKLWPQLTRTHPLALLWCRFLKRAFATTPTAPRLGHRASTLKGVGNSFPCPRSVDFQLHIHPLRSAPRSAGATSGLPTAISHARDTEVFRNLSLEGLTRTRPQSLTPQQRRS